MSEDCAAGRKTDQVEGRRDRIVTSLEEQFHICRKETDIWLERNRTDEGFLYHNKLDGLIKLVRVNAELASVIARIDGAKNRNSKA
jgi:hypothetical protein